MPTARLITSLVNTLASISGGAVLTLEGKTDTTTEGLDVVDELFSLLAETIGTQNPLKPDDREEIIRFLKRCTRRYGTVRHAVQAFAESRREHPLISRNKAVAWASVMSVIPSAIDSSLRRHPALKTHVSRWCSDQGSTLNTRLDALNAWLDAPFPEEETVIGAPATAASAETRAGDPTAFDPSDEPALELLRILIADKRPGLHPDDRRPDEVEIPKRESLADSNNGFARLVVALSTGDLDAAESALKRHGKKIPESLLHTLRGETAYQAARFDDACGHFRTAMLHCDAPECAINLAISLARASTGTAPERTKEAIDVLCSLRDRQSEQDPARVRTLIVIGSAWLHATTGDRDANISLAIEALEAALSTLKREEDPHWWAEAHLQLGAAWQGKPAGKRVENIQRAITCFTRAEEIWTTETHPEHWATIQNNLGYAWESLPTGHRAINMQRAIDYFNAALEVREKADSPIAVATIRNNLGNAWIKFPAGDHEENIRRGIEQHTAALEVWSAQNRRSEWAATQNNLGNAWALLRDQSDEAREKNLRRAISCYKAALEVRTKSSTPSEWASTQNNLGSALILLGNENRAKPIREAIECFNRALEVRTRAAFPVDWAKTQTNLGRAWERLPDGDPMRNLDTATEHFQNALGVFSEEAYPHQHRHTMTNLKHARDHMARLGFG